MEMVEQLVRSRIVSRLLSLLLATGIGVVFTLSALLVPSPAGHGTHLQLGLGSCTFLTLTGMPCPMCGATTSFTLMAHLRPLDAFINQPFAASLFLMSAAAFGVAASEVFDPKERWSKILRWIEPRETLFAGLFLAAMGLGWIYKLIEMSS